MTHGLPIDGKVGLQATGDDDPRGRPRAQGVGAVPPALLDQVEAQGEGPSWMVGHSYGGHAFGLLPENERVRRMATFATGAGWHGWMPPLERARVMLLWHVIGPLLVPAADLSTRALGPRWLLGCLCLLMCLVAQTVRHCSSPVQPMPRFHCEEG